MNKDNPLGLSKRKWETLTGKYGLRGTEDLLRVCPYELAVAQDVDFETIDEYVMSGVKVDRLCPARLSHALRYTLRAIESGAGRAEDESEFGELIYHVAGSTCIPKSEAYVYIEKLCGLEEGDITLTLLDTVVKHLSITGKISVTRVDDRIMLASKRAHDAERRAAKRVKELLTKDGIVSIKHKDQIAMFQSIDCAMAATDQLLSQEQKNGVSMILTNRISVLTGGPGTGKSATQNVLIKALNILKPNATVRCIAPTGMAASRMQEATGYPASTIHSALKIYPGEEGSRATIGDDLILVDESSMIDTFLLADLLESVSDNSSIVFIGDTAQLPSISAGSILHELIRSKVPVTELTKVFRQGDNSIAFNCAKIKNGSPSLEEDASFSFIECDSSEEIAKKVCEIYAKEVAKSGIDSVCCLTPYRRKTKTGVNQLNRSIRKTLTGEIKRSYCEHDGRRIYRGDKVTFLRNRSGLVNGETGFVTNAYGDNCTCVFGGKEITLEGEDILMIEPAFAQTVHKAQGQEYKTCIIVCDKEHSSFLSRNLVYTSISRAKKNCICIGSKETLKNAILAGDKQERLGTLSGLIGQ